jgi:hypothetical protein
MTHAFQSIGGPASSLYDFQLARAVGESGRQASANRASLVFGANTAAVAPANLVAPANVILAAIELTPKVSGRFVFMFGFSFTDSAADSVGLAVTAGPAVAVTGGTLLNNIVWESSPITAAGFAATQTPAIWGQTFAAGNLTQSATIAGMTATLPVGTPALIILSVSATHNLSGMDLTASAFELP